MPIPVPPPPKPVMVDQEIDAGVTTVEEGVQTDNSFKCRCGKEFRKQASLFQHMRMTGHEDDLGFRNIPMECGVGDLNNSFFNQRCKEWDMDRLHMEQFYSDSDDPQFLWHFGIPPHVDKKQE